MIDPDPIVSVVGQGFAVVYGLVIGSFLAVCIQRLPEDRSLRVPSACERCGAKLGWTENIPLVSYLALRGRCRHCGSRIPPLHPLVEALGGLLGWLVYRRVIADPADLDAAHAAAWVVRFGFLALLVVAAYVDVRHRIIPDQTSIYAVPFGIAAAVVLGWLGYDGFGTVTWQLAVLGAAGWGAAFALFSLGLRYVTGIDALGWGDVKLITMLGAFLGPAGMLVVLLVGSVGSSIVGTVMMLVQRRRIGLPFGPPLAAAATVYVLWGDAIPVLLYGH